jgi:hypothetical protein
METVNPHYYGMATLIFHLYVSFIAVRDKCGAMFVQPVEKMEFYLKSNWLASIAGQR